MRFSTTRCFSIWVLLQRYKDIQLSVFTSFIPTAMGSTLFFGDFTHAGAGTVQGIELE